MQTLDQSCIITDNKPFHGYSMTIKWDSGQTWVAKGSKLGKLNASYITDESGIEIARLKYNYLGNGLKSLVSPGYYILINNEKVCQVNRKLTICEDFEINGSEYKLINDKEHQLNWSIQKYGEEVATIKWHESGDRTVNYTVKAYDTDRVFAASVCIAIDMAMKLLIRSA